MTEPPALMTVPDEEASGLWLWHGAPPDQQNRQKARRRNPFWLSISAALITALSTVAVLVLIATQLPEPATPSASSPMTVAIEGPPSPPPAVDTPPSVAPTPGVSTPASHPATVDTPPSTTAGAGLTALAPDLLGTPAWTPAEPAGDRAAEATRL